MTRVKHILQGCISGRKVATEVTFSRHFEYPTFSIPETRLPELQLPEPNPDIFEEPEPEIFQILERNPKIFRSNYEDEFSASNQNPFFYRILVLELNDIKNITTSLLLISRMIDENKKAIWSNG